MAGRFNERVEPGVHGLPAGPCAVEGDKLVMPDLKALRLQRQRVAHDVDMVAFQGKVRHILLYSGKK